MGNNSRRGGIVTPVLLSCFLVLFCAVGVESGGRTLLGARDHRYKDGDHVPLYANKVGPFHNPRWWSWSHTTFPLTFLLCRFLSSCLCNLVAQGSWSVAPCQLAYCLGIVALARVICGFTSRMVCMLDFIASYIGGRHCRPGHWGCAVIQCTWT